MLLAGRCRRPIRYGSPSAGRPAPTVVRGRHRAPILPGSVRPARSCWLAAAAHIEPSRAVSQGVEVRLTGGEGAGSGLLFGGEGQPAAAVNGEPVAEMLADIDLG